MEEARRGVLVRLKELIQRHKFYYGTAQYALSFGSFFFPLGTTNYDVVVEGLTSLTNMVAFLNEFTHQRDAETLEKCTTILHFTMLLVSHVEVFLEKVAKEHSDKLSSSVKDATIFCIETVKAAYRLTIIFLLEKSSAMIIQWGRGTGIDGKYTYSLDEYREFLDPLRQFPNTTPLEIPLDKSLFTMEDWEVDVSAMHEKYSQRKGTYNKRFIPERERLLDSPQIVNEGDSKPILHSKDPASVTFSPSRRNSSRDTVGICELPPPASPGSQYRPSSHSYEDPRFRSWHWYNLFSIHNKIPGGTKLLKRAQKLVDVGLNSDQLLLLGETLYVVRPAVYSFLLYRCNKRYEEGYAKFPNKCHQHIQKGHQLFALAVSMVLEVLSILCTTKALEMTEKDAPPSPKTTVAKVEHPMIEELNRRKAAFFLNLIRSPILDRATLPLLQKVLRVLRYLPLI